MERNYGIGPANFLSQSSIQDLNLAFGDNISEAHHSKHGGTPTTLFTANANQSAVFRELVPHPSNKEGAKKSLEIHLEDIICQSSLRDFYRLKEVYQRNSLCNVTGVLLELKDADIAANFLVSKQLQLSSSASPESDNEDEDVEDAFTSRSGAYMLKLSKQQESQSVSFYQRVFPREHTVTHCSVSDAYVIYTVEIEDQGLAELKVDVRDATKQTLIVVIDVKTKKEVVLKNPSAKKVTAVYTDEKVLVVGCVDSLFHLKPSSLFVGQSASQVSDVVTDFSEVALPAGQRSNCEIYALWHTKKQAKIDVFVRSTVKAEIAVFTLLTEEAIEKIRLAQLRSSFTKSGSGVGSKESAAEPEQIELSIRIDLNTDFLSNKPVTSPQAAAIRNTLHDVADEDMGSDASVDLDEEDDRQFNQDQGDSSDDEDYVSGGEGDEQNENDVNQLLVSGQQDQDDGQRNLSGGQNVLIDVSGLEPESPAVTPGMVKKKRTMRQRVPSVEGLPFSRKYSINELQEPFLDKGYEENRKKVEPLADNGQALASVFITSVKFSKRNTIVFRSDGQIDFISSNNVVYSSRNIDFKNMKWAPATSASIQMQRRSTSPTISDAVFDEHDLLLITGTGSVYLFSMDRMSVAKTKIKAEQAKLLPFGNRLNVFTDFLVYDNVVMVSHANMISICDLNARVCKQKSWRHLSQPDTDVAAEDRDTFSSQASRRDPFRACNLNVRLVKLREDKAHGVPRIMVLFQNNVIRMLLTDQNMQWKYDQLATKLVQGEVQSVVSSRRADSLVLLRHKEQSSADTSVLTVFYFKDKIEEMNRWVVLRDLKDHQRVIQISLSGRFMQDFSQQADLPKIGVYDDLTRELTIHQLEQVEAGRSGAFKAYSSYGEFRPIYTIKQLRLLPSDVVVESSTDTSIFYFARQNKIYQCFVSKEAARKAAVERESPSDPVADEHKNLELVTSIASRYAKYTAVIEDFRIVEDNKTTYVYASTRSHIYFNQLQQFGKLFSGSKLLPPSLARANFNLRVDDNYGQIAFFNGPFEVSVVPFLSSNRISMRGLFHEPEPLMYQTRGYESLHVLTRDSKLKTWNTNTGKLKSSVALEPDRFAGFRKMNCFRNRTILYRQMQDSLDYEYVCIEIVSKKKVIEYARVVSSDPMNFYINQNDNLLFTEHRGSKHNVFEVTQFDKKTGEFGAVVRTFNRNIPMNFLSPSFYHYIDIESHTHTIKVLDTFTDKLVCVLSPHLYKFMCAKQESFSTETFLQKLIFVDEDFILMHLDQSTEIVYHVPSQRTVCSFNSLSPNLKYNEKYFPTFYSQAVARQISRQNHTVKANDSLFTDQMQTIGMTKRRSVHQSRRDIVAQQSTDPLKDDKSKSEKQLLILEDLIYANMKRQRHIHFVEMQSVNTVIRDKAASTDGQDSVISSQLKLISVRSFSYAIWKLMDDLCSEKSIKVASLSSDQLATACFAILPDSQGNRIRQIMNTQKDQRVINLIKEKLASAPPSSPTLLHKLTAKNPEEIKPLIARMSQEWPKLVIPHIYNQEGQTPLKLAHMYRQRRVIGWLLDLLKDYPFGYCQFQVSNMIFDFIDEGFEGKVGDYLNSRFKSQKWTAPYSTGRLMIFESGINQTTVTNWPSRTQNLESKLFDSRCPSVPVQMRMLDCPNLHAFSKEDTQQLFLSLSRCDISIFSHKSIQALIEYSWESTRSVIIYGLFLPFTAYIIIYMVFLEILFSQETADEDWEHSLRTYSIITQTLLLVFAIYFIQLHVRQMLVHKFRLDGAVLWSSFDLVPLLANLVSIVIACLNQGDTREMIEVQKPIYACATLFLFLKMFYFLRYFREIGHLVRMIFTVMHQMRFFFVVFFCFVFTFSSAFYAFTGGQMTYAEQILFVFNITIRKSDTSWFSEGYELLLWIAFVGTSMFFTYIMLNITVSMVKGFYDANMRIKTESQYQVMTQLTLDCFPYVRAPKSERDLRPPEGTLEFVSEPCYVEADKSFFEFKLRQNSFCNQYLLVAETEQEDKGSLLSTDPDQQLRDLSTKVSHGFVGVQKQLQTQNQLGSKTQQQAGEAPVSDAFTKAVEAAVEKKLEDLKQSHAKEINSLKESQQEILSLLKASLNKED